MARRKTETKPDDPQDIRTVHDLRQDKRNANLGSERGDAMLRLSLERNGAGRSVLVDRNGVLIAGNKTARAAVDAGLPVRVVQTDGDELVVVQRVDLDMSWEQFGKARELALADNRVAEVSLTWDPLEIERFADELGADALLYFERGEMEAIIESVPAGFRHLEDADFDPAPHHERQPRLVEGRAIDRKQHHDPGQGPPHECFAQVLVRLPTADDAELFGLLLGQPVTSETRSIEFRTNTDQDPK